MPPGTWITHLHARQSVFLATRVIQGSRSPPGPALLTAWYCYWLHVLALHVSLLPLSSMRRSFFVPPVHFHASVHVSTCHLIFFCLLHVSSIKPQDSCKPCSSCPEFHDRPALALFRVPHTSPKVCSSSSNTTILTGGLQSPPPLPTPWTLVLPV
jgi:hypothetical protein